MYRLRRSFTIVVEKEITHKELEDYAMEKLKQDVNNIETTDYLYNYCCDMLDYRDGEIDGFTDIDYDLISIDEEYEDYHRPHENQTSLFQIGKE